MVQHNLESFCRYICSSVKPLVACLAQQSYLSDFSIFVRIDAKNFQRLAVKWKLFSDSLLSLIQLESDNRE